MLLKQDLFYKGEANKALCKKNEQARNIRAQGSAGYIVEGFEIADGNNFEAGMDGCYVGVVAGVVMDEVVEVGDADTVAVAVADIGVGNVGYGVGVVATNMYCWSLLH